MQVFCSNCNTAHEVTYNQAKNINTSVIHCSRCDKKIKFQFCPDCGAFYSITFSNIKHGRYKYNCKKCMKDFTIEFTPEEQVLPETLKKPVQPVMPPRPVQPASSAKPAEHPAPARYVEPVAAAKPVEHPAPARYVEPVAAAKPVEHPAPARHVEPVAAAKPVEHPEDDVTTDRTVEPVSFMNNSINTFSSAELFKSAWEAFTAKKIIISAAGIICMFLTLQLFNLAEKMLHRHAASAIIPFAGSLINLFPMAIVFSFYTLLASVVSKITLDRIFHSKETGTGELIRFTLTTGPGVFAANIIVLLTISAALILFGKIPLLGPVLFSIVFLPVYLISVTIFLLCFIGLWFYPPISAHRESGVSGNIRNLFLFIKKHNLNIVFMIPVILLVTAITFSIIFFIHLSAFSLSIAMSKWLLNQDASIIFSSVPSLFIKASEAAFTGLGSDMFKELNTSLLMTHHAGGFILGIIFITITLFLLSLAISVTATVSSHIYIVMERGISIDDRKKAIVLFVLMMLMILLIMFRRLI